jgi:hypothetical protein
VGIATTAPSKSLHVNGTVLVSDLTTGNLNFTGTMYQNGIPFTGSSSSSQWTNSGSNIFFSSGNVGIGTSNPSQRLVVSGTPISNIVETRIINNSFTSANLRLGVSSSSASAGNIITNALTGGSIISNDFGPLQLGANNGTFGSATGYLFIQTGGNVGISTTAPSKRLHVEGDVQISNLTSGNIFSTTGTLMCTSTTMSSLKATNATISSIKPSAVVLTSFVTASYFYTEYGYVSVPVTGTYYISPTAITCIGRLTVNIYNFTNLVWAAHGDVIIPYSDLDQLRPNLSNIVTFYHTTGGSNTISATLAPFAGANSNSTVTDSPANSFRVVISALSTSGSDYTIKWSLIKYTDAIY